MRTWMLTLGSIVAFFICASSGCRHDTAIDVSPAGSTGVAITNPANPTSGTWLVSYFNDSGEDMTRHLDGYTFDFRSGGTLAVFTGIQTISGSWRIDDYGSKQEFIIMLPGADEMLAELQEDWEIVTNTADKLELHHGHSGHVMDVRFTKQ